MALVATNRCNRAETLQFDEADPMRSKPPKSAVENDLFRQELVNIINMRHELV